MNENEKYKIIKKLIETDGNKNAAALKLNCTRRHINRMIRGYINHGKEFFVHGNRNRKPAHAFKEETKQLILALYKTKYYDCNLTHFKELMALKANTKAKRKNQSSVEKDTFTQFGYACKQLGIDIKTSSVAQAKGGLRECLALFNPALQLSCSLQAFLR